MSESRAERDARNYKFYIVSDLDRPSEGMVMQKINARGDLRYMDPGKTKGCKPNLKNLRNPTELRAFGFGIEIDLEKHEASFNLVSPSAAVYEDGELRLWQGSREFVLKLLPIQVYK